MSELANSRCEACNKFTPKLTSEEVQVLLKEVSGWEVIDGICLYKRFDQFKNFFEAFVFATRVAGTAEHQGHHPDITFGWRYAVITITTHAIKGLSKNDFILAAKIDALT